MGDPTKLRLSELFLSPLIGLDTLDSPRVAKLRKVARQIELKPGPTSKAELTWLSLTTPRIARRVPYAQLLSVSD